MNDALAARNFLGPAGEEAIESVHDMLDGLWSEVPLTQDIDRMTFTTAVIESASNVVQHAEPVGEEPVKLGVVITVRHTVLEARVSALHAKPPYGGMVPVMPEDDAESGRGLALIQALVTTVIFERQDGTNTWVLSRGYSQDRPLPDSRADSGVRPPP
ncbi:ATP-binding protein [Arthrobacter sp. MDT2-16]